MYLHLVNFPWLDLISWFFLELIFSLFCLWESLIQHFFQPTFQDIFPLCNFWAYKVCYVDPTPALFHLAELWVVIRCAWITFRAWVTKLKSQEWYCSGSFILFNLKSTYSPWNMKLKKQYCFGTFCDTKILFAWIVNQLSFKMCSKAYLTHRLWEI